MRTNTGAIAAAIIALFLGVLAATQFRSQDVYSRSLQLETPSSLTTLIANLSERNNALREEILDLRLRVESAQDAVATGKGTLSEGERQIAQLKIFTAQSAASGSGITVKIDGAFDERALSDLVNELRNAGAEALAVNEMRVGPRSYFTAAPGGIAVDGRAMRGPWMVRAIGSPEVIYVAMTRTGGIIGQFELIYPRTRFAVAKESALDMAALATPLR